MQTDHASSWNPNRFVRYERNSGILTRPWRLTCDTLSLPPVSCW
jgi:hypothetical protein